MKRARPPDAQLSLFDVTPSAPASRDPFMVSGGAPTGAPESNHPAQHEGDLNPSAGNKAVRDEYGKYGASAPSSGAAPFDSASGSAQGERVLGGSPRPALSPHLTPVLGGPH